MGQGGGVIHREEGGDAEDGSSQGGRVEIEPESSKESKGPSPSCWAE